MSTEIDLKGLAERFDQHDMATVIRRLPDQIEYAVHAELPEPPPAPPSGFRQIVSLGMGGSALSGEIIRDTLRRELRATLHVSKGYECGLAVGERTLVVASSFSGNTEETLEALDGLSASGAGIIVLTAGGKFAAAAADRGFTAVTIPHHLEPPGFQPRYATGYSVVLLSRILAAAGVLADVRGAFADMPDFLRRLSVRDEAQDFAVWIGDRMPVIYSGQSMEASVARIVEIKFNENTKRIAISGAIPEVNHNQICGFQRPTCDFAVIYLHDPANHASVRDRYLVMRDLFVREGLDHVGFREWTIPGGSPMERIFAALVFGDWLTYTRALLDGVDPTPVALIERFKEELRVARVGSPSASG